MILYWISEGLPDGSVVKNPPAMQEPQEPKVQPLGQEDPLEEEMAPHSSILAWEIPWTEEPGGLHLWVAKSRANTQIFRTSKSLEDFLSFFCLSHLKFSFFPFSSF